MPILQLLSLKTVSKAFLIFTVTMQASRVQSLLTNVITRHRHRPLRLFSTKAQTTTPISNNTPEPSNADKLLNLSTISEDDLLTLVKSWGYPAFRARQVHHWIRAQGVTDVDRMGNVPASLRSQLAAYSRPSALDIVAERVSSDGTIKRAYQCGGGDAIFESVLMPYADGRYTACISSQAGCAQGCVFCATGQMGFVRQLTSDEIFEQVARFAAELQQQRPTPQRLSNVVFMGMGEPLANYRHVSTAIHRITKELGIGARKITVSTVGIVPQIRKLTHDPALPPVRLAVSLHSANDKERSALIPANKRYGGLKQLFEALDEYISVQRRRVTFEWALIAGENDTAESARLLGQLITQSLRRDMVHVNVIPLNKTGKYGGRPSKRAAVDTFCAVLEKEFQVACTPRVRRGIDIDAGCGQLTASVMAEQKKELQDFMQQPVNVGVYEDENVVEDIDDLDEFPDVVDFDADEASEILAEVQGTTIDTSSIGSSP